MLYASMAGHASKEVTLSRWITKMHRRSNLVHSEFHHQLLPVFFISKNNKGSGHPYTITPLHHYTLTPLHH